MRKYKKLIVCSRNDRKSDYRSTTRSFNGFFPQKTTQTQTNQSNKWTNPYDTDQPNWADLSQATQTKQWQWKYAEKVPSSLPLTCLGLVCSFSLGWLSRVLWFGSVRLGWLVGLGWFIWFNHNLALHPRSFLLSFLSVIFMHWMTCRTTLGVRRNEQEKF